MQKSRSPSGQNIPIASIYQRRMTKLTGSHYIQEQTSVCYISPGSIAQATNHRVAVKVLLLEKKEIYFIICVSRATGLLQSIR